MGYATKSKRGVLPKMVLIGDIVGDDEDAVAAAASEVVRLANTRHGEGFVAVSAEARKKFWLDRSRTAAIARHTNAFKINEDVVIPLPRMGEYTDHIERINIELSTSNKLRLLAELDAYLASPLPVGKAEDAADAEITRAEVLAERTRQAQELLAGARQRWQWLLDNLDLPLIQALPELGGLGLGALQGALSDRLAAQPAARVFDVVQDRTIRVSWKVEVLAGLQRLFSGAAGKRILDELVAIHGRVLKSRVFVALHMHAGDGNVHTNIPVNSDDYGMLREAHAAVERIMQIARDLDGVISGEHGIGLTKYEFLTEAELAPFQEYKRRVDPNGHFNAGKLMPGADLRHAWTPSFSLMGHESLIMQQSDIGAISESIRTACAVASASRSVRPTCRARTCCTRRATRSWRLAAGRGLPVRRADPSRRQPEALGRVRGRGRPLHGLPQVLHALSGGHRLRRRVHEHARAAAPHGPQVVQPGTASAMFFLNAKDPATINATRKAMVGVG